MSSANTAPSPGDLFSLDGKVAVITGGASGIGAATCRRFTAAGARCVIADIVDVAEGTEAAADLGGQYRQTDVSDTGRVDELVAAVVAEHSQFDIMVNNAGVLGPDGGLLAAQPDEARRMLDINLMGFAHGIRAAATRMAPGSAIVNTASMAGVVGFPGLGWYGMSAGLSTQLIEAAVDTEIVNENGLL